MKKSIKEIRERAKNFYKQLGSIYCPYFKDEVFFRSGGFNHLRYKSNCRKNQERYFRVQKIRYDFLYLAPKVIKYSGTLQEYEERSIYIVRKINKKREKNLKLIKFFGFIAIIKSRKLKVIVRQVGNSKKHFWSVMPNWKTRKPKETENF